MTYFLVRPAVVFVLSFLVLSVAGWLGAHLRRKVGFDEARRQDFGVVLAATLTLLGLLIGFTFSMAASRYDQRKNLEEEEANAIGTEYLRADLLPAADGARLRELLRKYVELRIRFYTAEHDTVGRVNAETARLQNDLWAAVVVPAQQQPNPVMALVLAGMNDVVNAQGYTQAAWWNRIPMTAAMLMAIVAVLCNVMVGYGSLSVAPRSPLLLILPLFVAVAFALIADIDTPRRGFIHVVPQNLLSLLESMKPR
jgi:hypothetical protein